MSRAADIPFIAVTTEGGLLPGQLLQRIAQPDARTPLPGRQAADYHLFGPTVEDEINQQYNRLKTTWTAFQKQLAAAPPDAAHVGLTRERWLMPLLQALGFGRLPRAEAEQLDGRAWPISHRYGDSPVHLLGYGVPLDTRTPGVPGAATAAPHGLVQGYLNRKDPDLWGLLSNGRRLRILRDHESLTRQAYVEFDLEAIFEGDLFSDFRLLWLTAHQSRFESRADDADGAPTPARCWLEVWHGEARDQGVAWQDQLRDGVQAAIEALGAGFLAHPRNTALDAALRDPDDPFDGRRYYRELLRLVYRLIFVFVAEDRDLLLDPRADADARDRYRRYYATHRMRRLAEARVGGPHPDLWRGLRLVLAGLDAGLPALGLPALGSFLFGPAATPHLDRAELANRDLLRALRALCATEADGVRYPVDWRTVGAEELGSVYESLLELHPELNIDAARFTLRTAAGHDRKTTGSYYTPAPLVECLLDTALDPVIDRAVRAADPEAALLDLKICDPACGSGHFLLAAARRLAHRLAAVRDDEDEPSPPAVRRALRDVVSRCIYGVDLNEMAVELCRISLWMEALDPGRPLAFLDSHVKHGNALLGATPALLRGGIPDDAFGAIEGDDKATCTALRKQNKKERRPAKVAEGMPQTQLGLSLGTPWTRLGDLAAEILALEAISDDTIEGQRRKQDRYAELLASQGYAYNRLWADVWCAAFVSEKTPEAIAEGRGPITESTFRAVEANPIATDRRLVAEVRALAERYRFFHWHLEFPEVFRVDDAPDRPEMGWSGGFDCVLGNPPWDTLSPDTKEFFSTYDEAIRFLGSQEQKALVASLLADPTIATRWNVYRRDLYALVHFLKHSGRFQLYAEGNLGKGDFNVYRMFVELALAQIDANGFASQLVPEGLYSGANCAAIRRFLFDEHILTALLGFENRRHIWFTKVDGRTKFALYSATPGGPSTHISAAFGITSLSALSNASRAHQRLNIPIVLVETFSPDALAVMEFERQADIDIASKMYAAAPKLGEFGRYEIHRHFMREVDMGNDRALFVEGAEGHPVYEGRMVSHYDHRAKGYRSGRGRSAVWDDLPFDDPTKSIQPQWRVSEGALPDKLFDRVLGYRIGFCDVASPTNERSLTMALIPPGTVCGHKVPTMTFGVVDRLAVPSWIEHPWYLAIALAIGNSLVMDYLVRKKVSLTMSYTIMDSLPFPRPSLDDPALGFIAPRVLRLTCTGPEMNGYWNAMARRHGWVDPIADDADPPGTTDDDERRRLMAELDAFVARVFYGLTWDELDYVLGTFPIVEKRDRAAFGDFRTREWIKSAFDRIDAELRAGVSVDALLSAAATAD